MAMKPNYNFEKRQRELAKKKQQDEKRMKKQKSGSKDSATDAPATPGNTTHSGSR